MEGTLQHDTDKPGEVTFSSFVLMVGTTAMVHLGMAPDPASGQQKPDLPQAKHVIDLLGVIQEKTMGNLTADEASLLEHLLYDLRLRYLEAAKTG
jgi:uncharacterized protein DUF1844